MLAERQRMEVEAERPEEQMNTEGVPVVTALHSWLRNKN